LKASDLQIVGWGADEACILALAGERSVSTIVIWGNCRDGSRG
jgi:hypothetical protein